MNEIEWRIQQRILESVQERIEQRLVREPVYEEDVPAGVIPLSVELPDPGWYEVEW